MGSSKESLEKKNVSAEKYDEIRRLDGTCQLSGFLRLNYYTRSDVVILLESILIHCRVFRLNHNNGSSVN